MPGKVVCTSAPAASDHFNPNSSINKGKSAAEFTVDLFREFKWSDAAGALVQTTFPGIYPDLTRYQAETDQAMVNQGQDFWKTTATQVASHLAMDLLKWPSANASVESGGGASDTDAIILVTTSGPNKQVRVSQHQRRHLGSNPCSNWHDSAYYRSPEPCISHQPCHGKRQQ